jgi:hypothetical protein
VRQQSETLVGEELGVDLWLVGEDIETGRRELAILERLEECLLVNDTSTGSVDKARSLLHLVELLAAEELVGLVVEGDVEGDDVGLREELVQGLAVGN